MAGEKIIEIINRAKKEDDASSTEFLFGQVTSIAPLKIKIDNRYEVDEKFLILSAMCKEMVIKIAAHTHSVPAHSTQSGGDGHSHSVNEQSTAAALSSVKLWRGLKVGDKVRMLRVSKGQQFYVLEREEGIV